MRSGRVHVLADETGERLLPSVVSFHPGGDVLVGAPAKARRANDPRNTVASHKRLIGRSWNSPEIVQARARVPYELREGPAQGPLVHTRGKEYSLPEISAFVLKRAKQIGETALSEPVMRAVVTVPAHFNELQRASTKVAGRVAGLEVLRILNEPTAAALAYGLGRVGNERIAVYDFGGGTFDCTLLDLNNNVFEVLATAGDTFLGGDDVDTAIAERLAERLLKQQRVDARSDPGIWERLRAAAEELKIHLSTHDHGLARVNDLAYGVGGAAVSLELPMSRGELDHLLQPLVDRTFKVTQDALNLARLTPTSFDKVVLVGGSSRMPLVRRRVEAFFGAPPMDRINPDEVVAIGAAIQAAALTDGAGRRPIPAPPRVPTASPRTLRGVQDEESTARRMLRPDSTGSAPPYAATGSSPPPIGRSDSDPPYVSRSAPPPLSPAASAQQAYIDAEFSGTIHDPRRYDDEPSIPSFPGVPVPSYSEFYEGEVPTDWGSDEPTEWASPAPQAPPEQTLTSNLPQPRSVPGFGGRSGEFGTIDELPSIVSTSGASIPSYSALTAAVSPADLEDSGDLTSNSAMSSPGIVPGGVPSPVGPLAGSAMRGAPPPRKDEIPFGPMTDIALQRPQRPPQRPEDPPEPRVPPGKRSDPSLPYPSQAPLPSVKRPPEPAGMKRTQPLTGSPLPPPVAPPLPPPVAPPQVGSPLSPQVGSPPPPPVAPLFPYPPQRTQPLPAGQPAAQAPMSPFGGYPAGPPQSYREQGLPPQASAPGHAQLHGQISGPIQGQMHGQMHDRGQMPAPMRAPMSGPMGPQAGYHAIQDPGMSGPYPAAPHQYRAPGPVPILVDVTPRALVVETAGGYCDTVIPRNAKIPCERTRKFATGRDLQTIVRVRVAQGEHPGFAQNTYLGEVELSGLRPAGRGDVVVSVTFELDADGIVQVRASDAMTGQEARARLRLLGVADEESVVDMVQRMGDPATGFRS